MKHSSIALSFLLFTAASAAAQERPRYYVEVTPVPVKVISSSPKPAAASHYIPNPQTGDRYRGTNTAELLAEKQIAPSTPNASAGPRVIVVESAPRFSSPAQRMPSSSAYAGESQPRQYIPTVTRGNNGPNTSYTAESMPRQYAPQPSPTNNVVRTVQSAPRQYMEPPNLAAAKTGTKMSSGLSLRGFSTGDDDVDSYILDSSRRYRIDPLLIYSQMGKESSYKPKAMSPKGATGLMQLMPKTAQRMGVTNIWDPKQNIEGGVKYMRLLLDMFNGNVELALAGYNAGEQAVIKYGYQIPPYKETVDYVARITARYRSMTRSTTASIADRSRSSF